jgi:hypothetical protein
MSKGNTPPEITNGSFVSWPGGKGRVDLIVRSGKVPGVDDDIEGSDKTPAARVVVWEDDKPTRKKIGKSTHTLKRIPPLNKNKTEGKTEGLGSALVALHADHAQLCEETQSVAGVNLTGMAIKTAYERGLASYPGADVTVLSAEEWALGRAAHLCKVARGEAEETNDTDLLNPAHPLVAGDQPQGQEELDLAISDQTVEEADAAPGNGVLPEESLFDEDTETPPGEPDPAAVETPEDGAEVETPDVDEDEVQTPEGDEDEDEETKTVTLDRADIDAQLAELFGTVDR